MAGRSTRALDRSEIMTSFLITLPLILAIVVAVILWRQLEHRWLFLVTSVLALTGLQSIIAPAAIAVFLPGAGSNTPEAAAGGFGQSVVASAIVVAAIGVPFLWWLQCAFRKGKSGTAV